MSWEEMTRKTKPCRCGNGTVSYISEMDDWNRFREKTIINCERCREEATQTKRLNEEKAQLRRELLNKACRLAEEKYSHIWLEKFSGLNKKQAWEYLTNENGYPSLGTFYKHTKEMGGLESYLKWCFRKDFETNLKVLNISDPEIEKIISESRSI